MAQSPGAAPTWTPPAAPPGTPVVPPPNATLGQGIQPFDPYATTSPPPLGPPSPLPPSMPPPYYPYGTGAPGTGPPPPVVSPGQPSSLYPRGFPQSPGSGSAAGGPYQRLMQNTGFSYAWLYGDKGNQLQMNDVDISTSLVLQPFGRSEFGFRLSPGFAFHFLDGPSPPPDPNPTDLPAQLYDAYLDAQWDPRITQQFHLEVSFRTGVYSDFGTLTTDSVRFMGTGLAVIQVTPATAIELGVRYLDRIDIKILPAFGFRWEPNPQTKFDIFFPEPRLSKYWTTMGSADVWWYLGAKYGGGSWTVNRPSPEPTDRVDINDIRVLGGLEWSGLNQRRLFIEVGYVFDREIIFHTNVQSNLKLDDTFMLGAGFHF